ncbi:O-antigen ligase family protein [Vibrio metschnikovii]|uniref:O-antigen ligase family protein n=1 Tax=Vibrio metschnikovii TaxID=28172 RepID=UPI002FC9BA26
MKIESRIGASIYLLSILNIISMGFMFILGTHVSNIVYVFSFFVSIYLIKVSNHKFSLISYLVLIFVICIIAYSMLIRALDLTGYGQLNSLDLVSRVLVYLRGILITIIFLSLFKIDKDKCIKGINDAVCLTVICSLILLIPFIFGNVLPLNFYRSFIGVGTLTGFTGLFHNPNYWSMFILVSLVFLLRSFSMGKCNSLHVISIVGCLLNLVFSGSRMALVCLATILVVYVICYVKLSIKHLISMIFFIMLSLIFIKEVNFDEFLMFEKITDRTLRMFEHIESEPRYMLMMDYMTAVLKNPLLGIGLDNFFSFLVPHNNIVTTLVEFGFLGVCFIFGGFFMIAYRAMRADEKFVAISLFVLMIMISLMNDLYDVRATWLALGWLTYQSNLFLIKRF